MKILKVTKENEQYYSLDFIRGYNLGATQQAEIMSDRKKGKWITVQGRFGNEVECNQCHSVFWYWMGDYRFCPNCGADMRGEQE